MNKTVALDTNVISHALRGDRPELLTTLKRIHTYYIPWAVYGELLAGIKSGGNPTRHLRELEDFLTHNHVQLSEVTAASVAPFYANIYTALKQQGTPISPNDLWIAAECVSQGLPLFTFDEDFAHVSQILRFA